MKLTKNEMLLLNKYIETDKYFGVLKRLKIDKYLFIKIINQENLNDNEKKYILNIINNEIDYIKDKLFTAEEIILNINELERLKKKIEKRDNMKINKEGKEDMYENLEVLFVDVARIIMDNYNISIEDLKDILEDNLKE
jgi:hypothetical protein